MAEDEKRKMHSSPLWCAMPDKIFDVIDLCEEIGKKHGKKCKEIIFYKTICYLTELTCTGNRQAVDKRLIEDFYKPSPP